MNFIEFLLTVGIKLEPGSWILNQEERIVV